MPDKKMDISKVLAILAQPREKPAPLTDVVRLRLEIPYITKNRQVQVRPVRIVMPQGMETPVPLIYVPHYEMGEDSMELRDYLANGWAVACPDAFNDIYNGTLTDDDLVFNNAALYTLRRRTEFDKNRIGLAGGSAGAYMTMMLNGLQMGLCASVANGPIPNAYFNFKHYFLQANALNQAALSELQGTENLTGKTLDERLPFLTKLPIPFLGGLVGLFSPINDNFAEDDFAHWEACSPVGLADCYCSPIIMNHCTSDVLVPVDQLTRKFTYKTPGDSLPADFDMQLPAGLPGRLSMALDECLPTEAIHMEHIIVQEVDPDKPMPYDAGKQFNINIYDDGPPEGYGTHSSRLDLGRKLDVPYFQEMFERTAKETCILTSGMLKQLLERYQGKSLSLPGHTGVDDSVYGSLAIYREEIKAHLTDWIDVHGAEAFRNVYTSMCAQYYDQSMKDTMHSIFPNFAAE